MSSATVEEETQSGEGSSDPKLTQTQEDTLPEPEGQSITQTASGQTQEDAGAKKTAKKAEPKERKESVPYSRAIGTSPLPIARVQKILKADEELVMVQREAVLAIAIATEQFVKRLIEAVQRVAQREKRATVQQRDMLFVVRRADEFVFLDEIIQTVAPSAPLVKRKPKVTEKDEKRAATLLDQFVAQKRNEAGGGEEDVAMNEDGTMTLRET